MLKYLIIAAAILAGAGIISHAAGTASIACNVTGSAITGANNSRTMTIPDADLQAVLNWIKATQLQVVADKFNGGVTAGFNPTNGQLEWGWFQVSIVNGSTQAVQVYGTTPAVVPPPINLQ